MHRHAWLVDHFMSAFAEAFASAELLHACDIDRVDRGTVVGEQSRKRSPDDLGAVDDRDGAP